MLPHTVNAKNALRPMPGACAKGVFERRPVKRVPIPAERQVAIITEEKSIPVAER